MSVIAAVTSPLASLVIDVTGLAGLLVLLAPVAVLIAVIVKAHRASVREDEPSDEVAVIQRILPDVDFSALEEPSVAAPSTQEPPAPAAVVDAADKDKVEEKAAPATANGSAAGVAPPVAVADAIADAPPATIDWPARIAAAEAADNTAALPELYLAFARDEIGRARTGPAADHLRSAVRLAAKARNVPIQAEARLELAELAREAGDLTTACEHWQIARSLFREMKSQDKLGETESLMQRHGCPTDWVLNDF